MKLTQKEYDELWELQKRLTKEAETIKHILACREIQDETGKNFD